MMNRILHQRHSVETLQTLRGLRLWGHTKPGFRPPDMELTSLPQGLLEQLKLDNLPLYQSLRDKERRRWDRAIEDPCDH